MATLQDVRKYAASRPVVIYLDSNEIEWESQWCVSGQHYGLVSFDGITKAEAYQYVVDDLKALTPCDGSWCSRTAEGTCGQLVLTGSSYFVGRIIETPVVTPPSTPAPVVDTKPVSGHSWIKVDEWNGLVKGAPLKVSGERGSWTFVSAHELNGEIIAVNVHGGTSGHTSMRSFYPHRVTPIKAKRQRKVRIEA